MSTTNGTMRVAVYRRNDDVRLEQLPIPSLEPGDLLVKTEACGLCGGETMEWYLAKRAPKVLGHEPTGVVVRTGPGPNPFKEGDRVFAHHHVPCMSCHYCNRGLYTLCEHYGQTHLDPGGFADYFRVPAENARLDTHRLPDCVSFEAGTIIEPIACTLRGVRQTDIRPGDTVAVIGLGFMGMCYLELLRLSPAARIVALDFSDWRLEKARSLGATDTINPKREDAVERLRDLNQGRRADAVFIVAPNLKAWELGLALCEKGASLHCGAPPPPDVVWHVGPNDLFFREIRLNSAYSATHIDTHAVLDLLAAGRVDAQALITHRFGLDQVEEAIRLLLSADASLKSLIIPSSTAA
jgi:L-iditol 2-dehydrogenase